MKEEKYLGMSMPSTAAMNDELVSAEQATSACIKQHIP